MDVSDVLNLVAIIIAPVIAVWVGQTLQDLTEKRKDKLEVFKLLMMSRSGWDAESVRTLNIIDIVFSDDKTVRERWKEYYDKLCVDNPTDAEKQKIIISHDKLLVAMTNSLGYKDKVTWETIQNPYVPNWLVESMQKQREYQEGQLEWAKLVAIFRSIIEMKSATTPKNDNTGQSERGQG